MVRQPVEFGITGFGFAFGEDHDVAETAGDYVRDPDRVLRWGCRTFHRAAPEVHATDLAAQAAGQALDRSGATPADVDLVVLANSEMPEFMYWDSSAALARAMKIERTQTLLLNEGCGAGITGLQHVAALMAIQPDLQTAVFVAVNRVSEYHRNRMNINNSVHSDAAVAVTLRRGHPRNRWLATEQFTDPELVDWFRGDYGGAVEPVPPAGWSAQTSGSGYDRVQAHFDRDPRRLRRFLVERNERVLEAVDSACARAGVTRDDIAHVIYINDSTEAIRVIADPLGVPLERTNADISPLHGHMGAADQLVSYGQRLAEGAFAPGDIVALCGISTGMRWCATVIQA